MSSRFARALFAVALSVPNFALAQSEPQSEPQSDLDEIIVTLSGHERRRFDVIQGSVVLDGEALRREVAATLGDTLEGQTGVTTTGFAPGSSRPVIRGQGGPRLRVLQNGLSSIDVSANSPDHQVATPPLLAERIEVLRGAGALRYGSNAIGGVVNVLDGRIAERLSDEPFEGALDLQHGTNAEARRGAFALRASGEKSVLYLNLFGRRSHDLEINGAALSEAPHHEEEHHDDEEEEEEGEEHAHEEEEDPLEGVTGRVPDTHADFDGGTIGLSRVGERGYFGVAYTRLRSHYGVPIAHGHEEDDHDPDPMDMQMVMPEDPHAREDEHEGAVSVDNDLTQHRVEIAAGLRPRAGFIEEMKVRAGYADYEHFELETLEDGDSFVGTHFENRGYDLRAEFVQRARDGLDGVFGFEHRAEERDASGSEAYLPKHEIELFAAFLSEEWHHGRLTLEGGARFERSVRDPANDAPRRSFNTWSATASAAFAPTPTTTLGLALARTERPPTAEELYADGPHFGTGGFEIGDPALESETAWSLEASAKRRRGRMSGALNLYATRFDAFIFPRDTGMERDGLTERRYAQADARFYGVELDLALPLVEFGRGALALDLGFDHVRGEFRHASADGGKDLPRIPPWTAQLGATLDMGRATFSVEGRYVARQHRVAANETPTASHFVVNAEAALRVDEPVFGPAFTVFLQAHNIGDENGRNHVSYLKERLPIAGRDLRLGVRWLF